MAHLSTPFPAVPSHGCVPACHGGPAWLFAPWPGATSGFSPQRSSGRREASSGRTSKLRSTVCSKVSMKPHISQHIWDNIWDF